MNCTRILGIDHGEARVGVAVSDELGMLAHPVETIAVKKTDPIARITALAKEKGATLIVVGLPKNMDGSQGSAAEHCKVFADKLSKKSGLPVRLWDERLSTVSAQRALHEAGRNARSSKNVIDQAAAVVILQSFLDSGNVTSSPFDAVLDDEP